MLVRKQGVSIDRGTGCWHLLVRLFTFKDLFPFDFSMRAALRALWQRGGKRRESLQLPLWKLNICIEKVDAKCWFSEMTLVMTSLPSFTCFSMFVYIRARLRCALIGGNLTAQSAGNHRGIGGVIQIPEKQWQAVIPFPVPAARALPESLHAGYFDFRFTDFFWMT